MTDRTYRPSVFLVVAPTPHGVRDIVVSLRALGHGVEHLSDYARLETAHDPTRHRAVLMQAGPGDVHHASALARVGALRRRAPARALGVLLAPADADGIREVVREGAWPLLLPQQLADIQAFAEHATRETPVHRILQQCLSWVLQESGTNVNSVRREMLELAVHGASRAEIKAQLELDTPSFRKHERRLGHETGMDDLWDNVALIIRLAEGQPNVWVPPIRAARCATPSHPPHDDAAQHESP